MSVAGPGRRCLWQPTGFIVPHSPPHLPSRLASISISTQAQRRCVAAIWNALPKDVPASLRMRTRIALEGNALKAGIMKLGKIFEDVSTLAAECAEQADAAEQRRKPVREPRLFCHIPRVAH